MLLNKETKPNETKPKKYFLRRYLTIEQNAGRYGLMPFPMELSLGEHEQIK